MIALFALLTGLLAGLYPAVLLSSLPSVDALKSKAASVRENVLLRRGLVGFQFGTATVVFIGAIVISQQIGLFFSDRLGYSKEYVVSVATSRDWSRSGVRHMSNVRDIFARMPEVKEASFAYSIPNGNNIGTVGIYRQGGDSTTALTAQQEITDEHYAATYRIPLSAGVFFNAPDESAARDSLGIVLNETAARALGWEVPRDAVSQRVRLSGIPNVFTVSGIVKDYHFDAMSAPIRAQAFTHVSGIPVYRYLSFKLRPGNVGTAINALQQQWSKLMPDTPFDYTFMDETLNTIYRTELRLRKAASTATVLAFIIVLLGVVGLVSNSVRRRTKEIAIRKVIGASIPGIIRLFLREYLPVLLLAGLGASPLAYWIMQRWLENYATRITITVLPFALALGILVVLLSVLIILQTVSAAMANPVKSLKAE